MAPKKKAKTAAPPLACFAGAKITVIGANPFQRKLWEAKIGAGAAFLKPSQAASLKEGNDFVVICVEINQCVGCTRQFFTKSFLGDDAAVLALSSGEEPAPSRYRAGVASMAWKTTRRFSTNAP